MNCKYLLLSVATASFLLNGSADSAYTWDAGNPQPISTADLTVALDANNKVTQLTATPGGGGQTVTITGGKMTFADGATVVAGDGLLRFENPLEFERMLSVRYPSDGGRLIEYGDYVQYGGVKILENAPGDIEDCKLTYAVFSGGADGSLPTICNRKVENGVLSYQLQYVIQPSSWNKCAIVEIYFQDGDLYARTERCFYVPKATYPVGSDVTAAYGTSDYHAMNGAAGTTSTYMPKFISLRSSAPFARVEATTADVTASSSGRVMVYDTVSLTLSSVLACGISINGGRFAYRDYPDGSTISLPFVSKEGGTFAVESTEPLPATSTFTVTTNELPAAQWTSGWHVIAVNASLADLTADGIAATLGGVYLADADPVSAYVYRFSNDGKDASFQIQIKPGSLKGALVKLRQNGLDVEMTVTDFRYLSGTGVKLGDDLSGSGSASYLTFTKPIGDGYFVNSLTLTLPPRGRLLTISGSHIWTNTVVSVSGTTTAKAILQVEGSTALPNKGAVRVNEGGVLVVGDGNGEFPGGGTCPIVVSEGGELIQLGKDGQFSNTIPYAQVLTIDGGTLNLGYGATALKSSLDRVNTAGSSYVNHLTMKNGACLTGHAPRVGISADCSWTVEGSSPSVCESGISLVGTQSASGGTIRFDVADVTHDASADFLVNGDIGRYNNAAYNFNLVKTGAGTMLLNGFTDFTNKVISVCGGAFALGKSGTFTKDHNLLLAGGGVIGVANTVNPVGTVALVEDSPVAVEAGAALQFADSSAVAWEAGKTLDVTIPTNSVGALQGTVSFGTTAGGLTADQVRQVRLNGKRCQLSETGALGPVVGFVMVVR